MKQNGRASLVQRALARLIPEPILEDQQPMLIAIMIVSLGATASFVMPEGLILVVVTALAVAYRLRLLIVLQALASIYLVSISDFELPAMPLVASGGVFLPNVLLPVLTAHWTATSTNTGPRSPSAWHALLYAVTFVAALFAITVLIFTIANASEPIRQYFALYPHGIRLVAVIFLLAALFITFQFTVGYYRFSRKDVAEHRMYIHQTLYQLARSEERILFRRKRNRKEHHSNATTRPAK